MNTSLRVLLFLLCFALVPSGVGVGTALAASSADVESLLNPLVGVAYRPDGASTPDGANTLFADESASFSTPGFNCSGFVLAASRVLLGTATTVGEAKRDRLSDSGPGSPHGEDWDFGWDLLLNLSEGKKRVFLQPDGGTADPATLTGFEAIGYDFHAQGEFDTLLARLKKDHLYLLSFNRATSKKGYTLMHYHVGLMVLNAEGQILMYQTTTESKKVYCRNMSDPKDKAAFLKAFANTSSGRKHMAVLDVSMKPE